MTDSQRTVASLRHATVEDIGTLSRLWFDTWHATSPQLEHPEPYERWEERLRDEILPGETVLVAEIDGQTVGFMALREPEGYLHLLYITSSLHNYGVGSLLLGEAMRRCPSGLTLNTLASNTRARQFYERHGWFAAEETVHPRTGHPGMIYRWLPETPNPGES